MIPNTQLVNIKDSVNSVDSVNSEDNKDIKANGNLNEQNKINLKKIKYRLKNVSHEEYMKNYVSGCFKAELECSYDFLVYQYGKPSITNKIYYNSNSSNLNAPNPIRASWYIKVQTSNNVEYYIDIYDWEQANVELKDVFKWCVGGSVGPCEYLNWDKLLKLLKFQYSNYNKRMEKLAKKEQEKQEKQNKTLKSIVNKKPYQMEQIEQMVQVEQIEQVEQVEQIEQIEQNSKFVDETKYKKLDNEKLKEFTDDDLACVLFTRFKESGNFLLKEALIIHRALNDPENYNKTYEKTSKKTFGHNQKKSNYKTNTKSFNSPNNIGKDKSKYNNKKDKSKYNNKK